MGKKRNSFKKWFPLGPYLRILICAFGVFFAISDATSGLYPVHDAASVFNLFLPYLPFIFLGLSLAAGILAWNIVFVTMLIFYGDSSMDWLALPLPAVLFPLYCAYLSPLKDLVISLSIFVSGSTAYFALSTISSPVQGIVFFLGFFSYFIGLILRRFRLQRERDQQKIISVQEAQLQARNEERTRLAYELHDIVAHEVTVIAMQARRAQFVKDPESTAAILTGIGDSASQALEDLRKLVTVLKAEKNDSLNGELPSAPQAEENLLLGDASLSGETTSALALTHDLHKISDALENAGFTVTLTVDGNVTLIPLVSRQALRRTAREIGTNVLKHGSPEGPVKIDLTVGQRNVTLSSENVISHNEPVSSSLTGLESLKARFHDLGGTSSYQNDHGVWKIQVSLPLPKTVAKAF